MHKRLCRVGNVNQNPMTKKDYILLAKMIKQHNEKDFIEAPFTPSHLATLCEFLSTTNPKFDTTKFLDACDRECVE